MRLISAVLITVVTLAAREALACDPACHETFIVDEGSILPVPDPGVPSVRDVQVQRAPEAPSTCGPYASAMIDVELTDEPVGYKVELGQGAPPSLVCDFSKPVKLFDGDSRLHLQWTEAAVTAPLDFEVTIKAVSQRGHESAPTRVRILHAGTQQPEPKPAPMPFGCGASSVPVPALGVLAALALSRRRA